MPNKSKHSPSADEIAEMATRGEDVSNFFTNQFSVMRPVAVSKIILDRGQVHATDVVDTALKDRQIASCSLDRLLPNQVGRAGPKE